MLLLPDELLVEFTPVPFFVSPRDVDPTILTNLMTENFERMPIASRAFDDAVGEGLYEAEFARDALIMSLLACDVRSDVTLRTVFRLAEVQGVCDRSSHGTISDREEVGRIPHEVRDRNDPIAVSYSQRFGWEWPYFGSVDATPLFISAAARLFMLDSSLFAETVVQRDGITRTIAECVELALEWLETRLNSSPIHLLESTIASNACWQVWADSPDAYHHTDGRLARGSVAAIEVQALVFDALLDAAELAEAKIIRGDACALRRRASEVRQSMLRYAWIEGNDCVPGYFANGIERIKGSVTPLATKSANMGLLLSSRILQGDGYRGFVDGIVYHLTNPETLWTRNGIRTLAADEWRFRPYAYHNGSIWPWQNFLIANGMRLHGFLNQADDIDRTIVRVCNVLQCAPEFIQGLDSETPMMNDALVQIQSSDGNGGTFVHHVMSPAQKFQGWTVFGLLALEQSAADIAAA